jgi:Zn finger protein HypA/HybF involved in hydrogenase expression
MGCYNTINIECPKCNNTIKVQTKSGNCSCIEYSFFEAPLKDLYALKDSYYCNKCDSIIEVKIPDTRYLQIRHKPLFIE